MAELQSFAPATGELLWTGTTGDVDAAVAAARAAWPDWAAQGFMKRIEQVRRYSNILRQQGDALAELIAREIGKPHWDAKHEVDEATGRIDIAINAYADRTAQRRIANSKESGAAVRHKPHGVMALLTPFNSPADIPNAQMIPALIAGNCILFKPSQKAPAVGQFLADAAEQAGLPAGVLQVVQGGPDIGRALVDHPDLNGVLFTGSAHAGIDINRRLTNRPGVILSLNMGGNNPIIVWDVADIHSAAAIVVQSAFRNAGQNCAAARRLIVKETIAGPLLTEVKRLVDRLVIDEPFAYPQPFMGPIIDEEMADGLTESFLALMSHGGKPIAHMTRPQGDLPFVTPGIIDVTKIEERPDIELFGPILQVVKVTDFDTAIAEANRTHYGLVASLIGGEAEHFDKFWALSRAGVVNWNRTTLSAIGEAPFGGLGLSGNNRPGGYYTADYCAYPVASLEVPEARAMIGIGLRNESDVSGEKSGEQSG